MNIAAIMPCRGRAEQTVTNVRRLLATAGYEDWHLYLAGGDDEVGTIWQACSKANITLQQVSMVTSARKRLTYWQALQTVTERIDAPLLINLANDLIPGMHWLRRAVTAYQHAFGSGDGMIGFNGDSHEAGHSCHFLISRGLLERYGGWPVWYNHNYGDTELCQRAIADRCYGKAPWALLFHDHPYFGGADDAVYAEGRAREARDRALFEERKRLGWPAVREAVHV
jgi:hypothetical protein